MNTPNKQKGEGFTIIEVVLVLAIAALILLMVFLALPALQRGQRDTQRKNDVSRLQSAITNYKSRNRGALPSTQAAWQSQVFGTEASNSGLHNGGDAFADPSGGDYVAVVPTGGDASSLSAGYNYSDNTAVNMYVLMGATCDGENATGNISTTSRKVAIVKPLEGGGRHCQEA